MSPVDAAAKAIAAIEGDPNALHEVSTKNGLTRVPIWMLYRVRAKAALEAARDPLCAAMKRQLDEDVDSDCERPTAEWLDAYDQALSR